MFAADGMKAVNTEDRPSTVTSETSPVHSRIVANRLIPLKLRTKKSANAITITVKEMTTFSKKKHPLSSWLRSPVFVKVESQSNSDGGRLYHLYSFPHPLVEQKFACVQFGIRLVQILTSRCLRVKYPGCHEKHSKK